MNTIADLQFITQSLPHLNHIEQVELALKGGCRWVQLRIKDQPETEIVNVAKKAREITRQYNAVLIINDNPAIAKTVEADGVHLGKNDCSPVKARQLLGPGFIIGATANTFADVQEMAKMPVDYLGIGPYKFTTTKKNLSPVLGLEGYKNLVKNCHDHHLTLPMVAIGSVQQADIASIAKTGMHGVAVSSAIAKAQSPAEATSLLIAALAKAKNSAIIN